MKKYKPGYANAAGRILSGFGGRSTSASVFVGSRAGAARRIIGGLCTKYAPVRARKRITTAGFVAFSWYVRATMAVIIIATLPITILNLFSMPLLGPAEFSWAKVVSRRRWREGERVRRGLYHRLFGPRIKQLFAYLHAFASNMAFLTLSLAVVLKSCTEMENVFKWSAVYALVPSFVLLVMGIVYNYTSRILQFQDPLPLRYNAKLLWRSPEKTYDRVEDSVLNLMFREQVQDAMSMSSLARLDRQLLFGIPTAIVACVCYIYDIHTGQEREATDIRGRARSHVGGVSSDLSRGIGFFRA